MADIALTYRVTVTARSAAAAIRLCVQNGSCAEST